MIFCAQFAFAGSLLIGRCDGVKRCSCLHRAQINILHTNGSPVQFRWRWGVHHDCSDPCCYHRTAGSRSGTSVEHKGHAETTSNAPCEHCPDQTSLVWATSLWAAPVTPGSCHPHNNTPAVQTLSLTFTTGRRTHSTTTRTTTKQARGPEVCCWLTPQYPAQSQLHTFHTRADGNDEIIIHTLAKGNQTFSYLLRRWTTDTINIRDGHGIKKRTVNLVKDPHVKYLYIFIEMSVTMLVLYFLLFLWVVLGFRLSQCCHRSTLLAHLQ